MARTYVQAAQGTIEKQHFEYVNGSFEATITYDAQITEPTVVYIYNHGKGILWYDEAPIVTLSGEVGEDPGTSVEILNNKLVISTSKENQHLDGKKLVIKV